MSSKVITENRSTAAAIPHRPVSLIDHKESNMRYIITLLLFSNLASSATRAGARDRKTSMKAKPTPFFQCGFEVGKRQQVSVLTDSFAPSEKNEIVTYAKSPVPQLPGGGERLLRMRLRKGTTNHPDLVWYQKKHAANSVYARFYFFLPKGHWEAGKGNGLKFFGIHGDSHANSPFNQAQTKLAPVGMDRFKLVTTKVGNTRKKHYSENSIGTGVWHLIEVHVKVDPDGEDVYEAWLDRDSRTEKPSIRVCAGRHLPGSEGTLLPCEQQQELGRGRNRP